MSKPLSKLYIRIIISAAIGFFFVGAFINIQYPCTQEMPGENIAQCVSFESAIMHPGDLNNNKQDSLTRFVSNFAIISLLCFALLSAYTRVQTKKKTRK
jgi:hypothetical protein